jgi:acyl-CoA hydrolase/RimJ/RimL family protein N-acetyltransferase
MTGAVRPRAYGDKLCSAEAAIGAIASGKRVFIGSSCGEPQHLTGALLDQAPRLADVELVRLLNLESAIPALMAEESGGRQFNIRSIYQGSGNVRSLVANKRFLTPMNLHAVPQLFRRKLLPLHFALVQVAPPDDFGYMNLGLSVDITLAAAQSAECVIAQVNPRMPVVTGQGYIHLDQIAVIVEQEEELLTVFDLPEYPFAEPIARMTANLVEDGSTVHLSPGITSKAIARALGSKNDLGAHTMFLTDEIMELLDQGVITNRRKGLHERKLIASCAIGSKRLYEQVHCNPAVEFYPSDHVNHPGIIAQCGQMVAIQQATAMDLKGQVAADAQPQNHFIGVTGMIDFVRGASLSPGGKSIVVIPALGDDGRTSRIVPELDVGAVVVPPSDVSYVVSEYGAENLFGKNLQERAMAMIGLAHPDARDLLFERAKELGLIGKERRLKETLLGVYPSRLEETVIVDGRQLTLRPVKPSDDRLVQEHFYNMDKRDILLRFFAPKKSFFRDEMESMFQVDYVRNLSIVAVAEEAGFGQIVGLGVYMLEPGRDLAEVAFTVLKEWQGKGLAQRILRRLADAARENGIGGFVAYVAAENTPMIRLFKKLPFAVNATYEQGEVVMVCRFRD